MGDLIRVDTATPVRTIRIARPEKKNALTSPMYVRLVEALDAANADSAVRAICILGGEGMFTAGNDIQEFLGFAEGGVLGREVLGFLKALVTNGKPLVAGVDGIAVGVGTTMLLHCDHVVASTRAVFSTPFVNLGLVPEAGSSLLAPRLMGHVRAFEMLAMARPFTAERALAAGLVNTVVSPEELEAAALAAATEIAAKPPEAVAIARRLLRGDTAALAARIDEESALFGERLRSDDARKAFATFLSRK